MLGPIAIADVMDRRAPRGDIVGGIAFVSFFFALLLLALRVRGAHVWSIPPFLPISATLWASADLLTAYLLLTQFSVNGLRAFAVLGAAYGVPGLLTIPYLVFFPGLFILAPMTLGTLQLSLWLWIAWHLIFPAIVGVYHACDRGLTARITSGIGIRRWIIGALIAGGAGCVALTALLVGVREQLPPLITSGGFTGAYFTIAAPAIVAVNLIAAVAILSSQRPSKLQLWLSVALIIAAFDGALNMYSSGRYTVTWYVGKVETLATAAIVLVILLSEVSSLYRRLGKLASIDVLTGLANRQAFDNDARLSLLIHQRRSEDIAFLVVDIDFFKQYNDTYGHQAGDVCLQRVAQCIRHTCARAVDLVGRFGGEEFVVLLQGTNAAGALRVGEAIRNCVEAMGVAHAGSSVAKVVTVSVGIAQVACGRDTNLEGLFKSADAALYDAKTTRNSVAMHGDSSVSEAVLAEQA